MALAIRTANLDDARALARLSTQLGYPTRAGALRRRLRPLLRARDAVVLVAVEGRAVVALAYVHAHGHLIEDKRAELGALVVDASARGRGIGTALVRAAEAWTRRAGLGAMRVRSRVQRKRAHAFYRREGYSLVKTQRVFERSVRRGR